VTRCSSIAATRAEPADQRRIEEAIKRSIALPQADDTPRRRCLWPRPDVSRA
jgi:hypothetical protein